MFTFNQLSICLFQKKKKKKKKLLAQITAASDENYLRNFLINLLKLFGTDRGVSFLFFSFFFFFLFPIFSIKSFLKAEEV